MARKRPTASDVKQHSDLICLQGGRPDADEPRLTRAEADDLRRTAGQTHAKLAEHLRGLTSGPPQRAVANDDDHDARASR